MEEIKVGEYVRTNEGTIDKVIEIKDKKNILLKDNLIKTTISTHKIFISKEIVKNHSKNIIDLISSLVYFNLHRSPLLSISYKPSHKLICPLINGSLSILTILFPFT